MKLFDKLNLALDFGNIQIVDEMAVIPIVGENLINEIARPEQVRFQSTTSYGTMVWENEAEDYDGLFPAHSMVVEKQAAQDHAMVETGLLKAKETRKWSNAICIEQTQGGYLHGAQDGDVLPLRLRVDVFSSDQRRKSGYSRFWSNIEQWLGPVTNKSGAHLAYFFGPHKKEIEDFTAQFEPVKNQLGAVIFFLHNPVGVEIMPTHGHWDYYWRWLIRGCYGAELLRLKLSGTLKSNKLSIPQELETAEDIEGYIKDLQSTFTDQLDIFDIETFGKYKKTGGFELNVVEGRKCSGEVVESDGKTIYASILRR